MNRNSPAAAILCSRPILPFICLRSIRCRGGGEFTISCSCILHLPCQKRIPQSPSKLNFRGPNSIQLNSIRTINPQESGSPSSRITLEPFIVIVSSFILPLPAHCCLLYSRFAQTKQREAKRTISLLPPLPIPSRPPAYLNGSCLFYSSPQTIGSSPPAALLICRRQFHGLRELLLPLLIPRAKLTSFTNSPPPPRPLFSISHKLRLAQRNLTLQIESISGQKLNPESLWPI